MPEFLGFLLISLVAPSQSLLLSPALPLDHCVAQDLLLHRHWLLGGLLGFHGIKNGPCTDGAQVYSPNFSSELPDSDTSHWSNRPLQVDMLQAEPKVPHVYLPVWHSDLSKWHRAPKCSGSRADLS